MWSLESDMLKFPLWKNGGYNIFVCLCVFVCLKVLRVEFCAPFLEIKHSTD